MEAGEGQGLRQVRLPLGRGHRPAGVDLDDDVAVEAVRRQPLQQFGARLGAAAGNEVLVLVGADAVRDVHVAEAVAHAVDHGQGVGAGGRGVREVDREVPVVVLGGVPVGGVGHHLAVAVAPREHVLDGEADVGLARHPPDAVDEVPRVVALPAEGRVDHHRRRAEPLGRVPRPLELHPRVGRPDPLSDEQAGGVHREDGYAVEVGQAPQCLDVLADRVGPHHDLDAVVAEARSDLEGRRRGLRIDGGRGQGDLRIGYAHSRLSHSRQPKAPAG